MVDSFVLFGFDHIVALSVIKMVALIPPIILRKFETPLIRKQFTKFLGWIMLIYFVFKHLYGPFGLGEAWQIWLPLHMCQLGHLIIIYCLLSIVYCLGNEERLFP